MPILKNFLRYWLWPILWMIAIFSASADAQSYQHSSTLFEPFIHWLFPHMAPENVEAIHHFFRKCCHVGEYAVLALLLWRAIHSRQKNVPRRWDWREAGFTLSIVLFYAASDEIHQIFVPTRTARFTDVCIDTMGGAIGLTLLFLVRKIFRRS